MIRSLTAIVTDGRDRQALRVAVEAHRVGARVIAKRLLQALRGEAGPDWQVVAEAMLADRSTRAGDYLDAASRESWKSDKPERYQLAIRALNECAPGWRDITGRERKAWLDNLPPEQATAVNAYYAAMDEEMRRRLAKWMRGKPPEDARTLLAFWLFDAKAEWAYHAQLARSRGERLLDLEAVAPALAMPTAHPIRKKAAEYAVQTISSYVEQYELWRAAIGEWRESRDEWERAHPDYVSVRDELFEFLAIPSGPKDTDTRRHRRLRPGATEYYPAYAEWLAARIRNPEIAAQIEGWHREWIREWAEEPKPPTYSEIRSNVSGLLIQRTTGYRALTVAANGDASVEMLLPVEAGGNYACAVEQISHYEWRTVRLRADPRLAQFNETQVSSARVLLRREGRVYLSFTTDDGIEPVSSLPLTPELCARYDARWVHRKATQVLGRAPRTVIAVFPLRERTSVLLRYYEEYVEGPPSRWKAMTCDMRLPTAKQPKGRRAGYSGSERGAQWGRYVDQKIEQTGALESLGRPARGQPFAVDESSGYRNRLRDTARRIAAAVIEQARAWGAELIIFDEFPLRSTDDEQLDRYRVMVHRRLTKELMISASRAGMCAAGIKVAARVQTCSRCGARTVRTTYRRDEGEIYSPFGERARCLGCGAVQSVEHLVASNLAAAINVRFEPVKALRSRVYDCGGTELDFANREQLMKRLAMVTGAGAS